MGPSGKDFRYTAGCSDYVSMAVVLLGMTIVEAVVTAIVFWLVRSFSVGWSLQA